MKKLAVGLFLVLFSPFAFSAISCEGFSDEDIGEVIDYKCLKPIHGGACAELTYIGNNRCLVLVIPREAKEAPWEEVFRGYYRSDLPKKPLRFEDPQRDQDRQTSSAREEAEVIGN